LTVSCVQYCKGRRTTMAPVRLSATALAAIAVLTFGSLADPGWRDGLLGLTAHAQSKVQTDIDRKVQALIDRLRRGAMPDGIVKSNGRVEATQVDVAAKYAGRLATLTVNEGDEVTAGQTVATISAPETDAQLRAAQAQVLRSKQALAEAVALVAQRNSDLAFTRTDFERGKTLLEHGNIPQQTVDLRRNKFEAADAAHAAALAQRDEAEFAIK